MISISANHYFLLIVLTGYGNFSQAKPLDKLITEFTCKMGLNQQEKLVESGTFS